MKLTLDYKDRQVDFEAVLDRTTGDYFYGTLLFEFKGAFPVDPTDFSNPPEPPSSVVGFSFYEVRPPRYTVTFKTDTHLYVASVRNPTPEGFTLAPHMAANLRAISKIVILPIK